LGVEPEEFEADEAAGDLEEGLVDVGAAFVADAEAAVLMEPADRALDDPSLFAQAGAVRCPLPGDLGGDPSGAELPAALA
jgi:hypothetical protein